MDLSIALIAVIGTNYIQPVKCVVLMCCANCTHAPIVNQSSLQQFRHRIVGFEHRMHFEESGTYFYGPRPEKGLSPEQFGYSLMGSASSFLHKAYLEMFHDPRILPRTTIDYIDHLMNCEDLAMCVVVGKFLEDIHQPQCAVLFVQAQRKITNMEMMSTGKSSCMYMLCVFAGCSKILAS